MMTWIFFLISMSPGILFLGYNINSVMEKGCNFSVYNIPNIFGAD